MQNAKTEFKEFLKEVGADILCARVGREISWNKYEWHYLKEGFSQKAWKQFLDELDFEYDAGYGGQELYGTIWFVDGTYADRGEYDGSEWWEYHKTPEIPKELKADD